MGNQSQKIQTSVQQHQRLGLITMLDPPQSQDEYQKVQVQKTVSSEKYYNSWLQKVRQVDTEMNRQYLYLPVKFRFEKGGVCGNSGVAYIEYEYFPFLLKNQIKNRRNLNQYFQETEIWYLLYKMVQLSALFEKTHKDWRFSSEKCAIRVISTLSMPNQTDNFQKIVEQILADVYLAPEQMQQQAIQKARYPDKVDPNRAEIFSIGITLLQAASLEDGSFIYTRNPLKIQFDKLQKMKTIVRDKYSGFLNQILKQMTQIDPRKRRSGQNLTQILRPYQSSILQLQAVNSSVIQHSSVKSSAFFNDGTYTSKSHIPKKH